MLIYIEPLVSFKEQVSHPISEVRKTIFIYPKIELSFPWKIARIAIFGGPISKFTRVRLNFVS